MKSGLIRGPLECWPLQIFLIFFLVFNATSSNISAISWQPVLVVEVAGVPEPPTLGKQLVNFDHLRMWDECTLFCNLQIQARTHAVLVIGLYELLGNPTT